MNKESQQLNLGVYRYLHNRPVDSPLELEDHNRRMQALHEIFDNNDSWKVHDWGATDDTEPHEYVELIIEIVTNPVVQAVAVPALTYIGGVISNATGGLVADGIKSLFTRLRNMQAEKRVDEVTISIPKGISIVVKPVNGDTDITVVQPGRQPINIRYNDTEKVIEAKKSS